MCKGVANSNAYNHQGHYWYRVANPTFFVVVIYGLAKGPLSHSDQFAALSNITDS